MVRSTASQSGCPLLSGRCCALFEAEITLGSLPSACSCIWPPPAWLRPPRPEYISLPASSLATPPGPGASSCLSRPDARRHFFNCPLLFSPGGGMIPTIVTLRGEELRIARSRLAFGLPIPPAPPLLTAPARPALSSVPSRLVVCAAPAFRGATSDGCVFPPRRPGWVSSFCGLARPFACG